MTPTQYARRSDGSIVEAAQLTTASGPDVFEWAESKPYYDPDAVGRATITGLTVFTPAGRVKANFGDWVVWSPAEPGWFVYSPTLFAETFDRAEADAR